MRHRTVKSYKIETGGMAMELSQTENKFEQNFGYNFTRKRQLRAATGTMNDNINILEAWIVNT